MSPWEIEWVELSQGVYLHRWHVLLAIVRGEVFRGLSYPDDLSDEEWHSVCHSIATAAIISWPECMHAGIGVHDFITVKEKYEYAVA